MRRSLWSRVKKLRGIPSVYLRRGWDEPAQRVLPESFFETDLLKENPDIERYVRNFHRLVEIAVEEIKRARDTEILKDLSYNLPRYLEAGDVEGALEYIEERVFKKWGTTGVQEVIDSSIYNALNMIVVYPVEDANKLIDHHGNVLPDAYLVKKGTTARELAYMIHTDLGRSFLYAIDARTKNRLGEDYVLKDGDVIKIVAGMRRRA